MELENQIGGDGIAHVHHSMRLAGSIEDYAVGPDPLTKGFHISTQQEYNHIICIAMRGVATIWLQGGEVTVQLLQILRGSIEYLPVSDSVVGLEAGVCGAISVMDNRYFHLRVILQSSLSSPLEHEISSMLSPWVVDGMKLECRVVRKRARPDPFSGFSLERLTLRYYEVRLT